MHLLGPCSVDLFATSLNNQLRRYASWHPNPFAIVTDAFTMSWQEEAGYAFSPLSVIGRCLQKIHHEKCAVVLIAPVRDTQLWYPIFLDLLVQSPLLFPPHKQLLVDPFNRVHPLVVKGQLQLAAWRLSGRDTLQREFQSRLPNSSELDGAKEPIRLTSWAGQDGLAGVYKRQVDPVSAGT